jgi:hypothetical protein
MFAAFLCVDASAAVKSTHHLKRGEVAAAIHACANQKVVADVIAQFANSESVRPLSVGEAKWEVIKTAVTTLDTNDELAQEMYDAALYRAQHNPGVFENFNLCVATVRLSQVKKKP